MPESKPHFDGPYGTKHVCHTWIKCWSEGRGRNKEVVVQIWYGQTNKPARKPDHDIGMPGIFDPISAINQAILENPPPEV